MGAATGFTLKLIQWFNRGVQFGCCGLILALTAYFLAAMSNNHISIPTNLKAVAGISGIGVIYTALGVILVCCLAGFTLTSFIAIVMDTGFVGAFIYVATVYKDGIQSCSGSSVRTVFGTGSASTRVTGPHKGGVTLPTYGTACRMETANVAVAIVAIVFFVISALTELGLGRHRKKEQRFGPSPANNYTNGYGGKSRGFGAIFKRSNEPTKDADDPNSLPMHTEPDELHRLSYTEDSTHVDGHGSTGYPKYGEAGYPEQHNGGAGSSPLPGATLNGFGNVHNYQKPNGPYGDGTYNV